MLTLVSVLTSMMVVDAQMTCKKTFSDPKATFDLTPLMKTSSWYFAKDDYELAGRPFSYYFNVCDGVKDSSIGAACKDTPMGASAYQVINATDTIKAECVKLGTTEDYEWKLLQMDNEATGVSLTYRKGQTCTSGKARTFTINFRCARETTSLPPVGGVSEDAFCEYSVDILTIHACPLECHAMTSNNMCSGHGLCGIDNTQQLARCFCFAGKAGTMCADEDKSGKGASASKVTSILVSLVIVLLIALLGLSGVLYFKIKKLNADDNPYGAFEDQVPMSAVEKQ